MGLSVVVEFSRRAWRWPVVGVLAVALAGGTMGCERQSKASEPAMKPVAEFKVEPKDDPTVKDHDKPDPEGERIRAASMKRLEALGFQPAKWLPTAGHRKFVAGKPRAAKEIAMRLMALDALFTYVALPEEKASTERLRAYAKRSGLESAMTEEERGIFRMDRAAAHQAHVNGIGWRLENMWALAWALGYSKEPALVGGMIPDEVTKDVVFEFLPGLDASVDDLLKKAKLRSSQELVALEDVFYCAHNTVRSAQMGKTDVVPEGFHPVADGGTIHERRHSLTWVLSPGVAWDDTDLST